VTRTVSVDAMALVKFEPIDKNPMFPSPGEAATATVSSSKCSRDGCDVLVVSSHTNSTSTVVASSANVRTTEMRLTLTPNCEASALSGFGDVEVLYCTLNWAGARALGAVAQSIPTASSGLHVADASKVQSPSAVALSGHTTAAMDCGRPAPPP